MAVIQTRSPPFSVENYQPLEHPIYKLNLDDLRNCLFNLDLKSLLNFSSINKKCYIISSDPVLWQIFSDKLNLKCALPICRESLKTTYTALYNWIYETLDLKNNLGIEFYKKIACLPIWCGDDIHCTGSIPPLFQIAQQEKDDKQNYFFKTLVDYDLCLILITANRAQSKIIRFNCGFDLYSLTQEDSYLYWEYGVGRSSDCFINTRVSDLEKVTDLNFAYNSLQKAIGACFGMDKFPAPPNTTQRLMWAMRLG